MFDLLLLLLLLVSVAFNLFTAMYVEVLPVLERACRSKRIGKIMNYAYLSFSLQVASWTYHARCAVTVALVNTTVSTPAMAAAGSSSEASGGTEPMSARTADGDRVPSTRRTVTSAGRAG